MLLQRVSPSISFPLRTVDGWSPRVIQSLRFFLGAGSTGGWKEWDRRWAEGIKADLQQCLPGQRNIPTAEAGANSYATLDDLPAAA